MTESGALVEALADTQACRHERCAAGEAPWGEHEQREEREALTGSPIGQPYRA